MDGYQDKIARILRTDKKVIENLEQGLEKITGKVGVLKMIVEEDERLLNDRLGILGLTRNSPALDVYDALISKIESDDLALLKYIGLERKDTSAAAQKTVDFVKRIHPPFMGDFLKKEKAKQFLIAEPPKRVLA